MWFCSYSYSAPLGDPLGCWSSAVITYMYPMKTNAYEGCQNAIKIIQQIKESCSLDVLLISTPAKPKTTHYQENNF